MRRVSRTFMQWIGTLNSVDVPGHNSFHRFILSARLGLWPAIVLSAFAFGHLLQYDATTTGVLSLNLCLVASIAFLFNDARDAAIDDANRVFRWSIRTTFDLQLFLGALAIYSVVTILSFFLLTGPAFVGAAIAMLVGIAYSLVCKKIFLLGNVVAAALSISPGLIMLFDVRMANEQRGDISWPAVLFLAIGFLLLMSREIKFDQFDLAGDRIGKRITVPMFMGDIALNMLHALFGVVALSLMALVLAFSGKFSWQLNLLLGLSTSLVTAGLMIVAYRSRSKEKFYKTTRLLMLVIPLSILLSF